MHAPRFPTADNHSLTFNPDIRSLSVTATEPGSFKWKGWGGGGHTLLNKGFSPHCHIDLHAWKNWLKKGRGRGSQAPTNMKNYDATNCCNLDVVFMISQKVFVKLISWQHALPCMPNPNFKMTTLNYPFFQPSGTKLYPSISIYR